MSVNRFGKCTMCGDYARDCVCGVPDMDTINKVASDIVEMVFGNGQLKQNEAGQIFCDSVGEFVSRDVWFADCVEWEKRGGWTTDIVVDYVNENFSGSFFFDGEDDDQHPIDLIVNAYFRILAEWAGK